VLCAETHSWPAAPRTSHGRSGPQSLSSAALQEAGQQPSPEEQPVMVVLAQVALQFWALPVS
jgi:hypothetical protein